MPTFDAAITRYPIWDITEDKPIPRGATVSWADCDDCAGLYYVEYQERVYAALPEELRF